MGLHICFMKDGVDHPKWDYIRQGNDYNFEKLINWDKCIFKEDDSGEWRPINIDELRHKIKKGNWDNKKRYLHLLTLVKNNPDYWLYFSH